MKLCEIFAESIPKGFFLWSVKYLKWKYIFPFSHMHLHKVTSCLLEFNMISEMRLSDDTQKIQSNQKSDHCSLSRDLTIISNYIVKFPILAMLHKRLFLIHWKYKVEVSKLVTDY